jgi:hypothetical protein
MENYKIIADEEKLQEFIDWLPPLGQSEGYYLQLFGRKKYLKDGDIHIQSGQQSLARLVCKKEEIVDKVKKLQVPLGLYKNRDVALPQECLALYITINPRCHERAAKNLLKVLADRITKPYEFYNVYQLAMTELHKACGKQYFVAFDFDFVDFSEIRDTIKETLNESAYKVVKTRGGFHLIVMIDKIGDRFKKHWYKTISGLGPDVKGHQEMLLPVVGTFQGGHVVQFINHE